MTTLRIFDPAMCCSSGVCGPSVDPTLARFAADLDWLATQGVSVTRFNLAHSPAAFFEASAVKAALEERGEAALPAIELDGKLISVGLYPDRAELARQCGLPEAPTRPTFATRAKCGPGCC